MITHGDRVHFVIEGLGSGTSETSKWLREDAQEASIKLSVDTLPTQPGAPLGAWDDYGTAALASGAFPVGLAPRALNYEARHYLSRKLPIDLREDVFIRPSFPPPLLGDPVASFKFQTVDGGMVNNNPFDYAQFALFGRPPTPEDRTAGRQAILMVAPFPDPPKFLPEGTPEPSLTAILRALYPALINQARFRISELAPALDERDYSRFLISPRRRIPRTEHPTPDSPARDERFPIACGLLGGFGGFLGESFRAHDFQLGRRNCQQFLREHFSVRSGGIVQGAPLSNGDVPVVPLFGSAAETVPLPCWPQIDDAALELIERRINLRFDAVVPALIDAQTKSRRLRFAMRRGWSWFLRGPARRYIHGIVLADLVRRGQIKGWEPPENLVRAVLTPERGRDDVVAVIAELINPAFQFRSEAGIATMLAIPPEFVAETLRALSADTVPLHLRSWRNDVGWTLWSNRPGFMARRPVVQVLTRWWNAPTVG
jgi:hypothetical protein